MKYIILFFLINIQLVSCQSINDNGAVFLGEQTKNNKFKVFQNNSIIYADRDVLKKYDTISNKEYIKRYPTKKFIKILDSLGLYFLSEGSEPFWSIKIKGKEAYFNDNITNKELQFELETSFQKVNDSGTNFMFKSLNEDLFGVIMSDISYNHIPKEPSCVLWNTELGNYSYYSIYISYKGQMYNGCVRIGNSYYDE